MTWYYVDAGQQAGPVDDSALAELVRSGKIQPDTLVWHEGMQAWSAYRNVAPSTGEGQAGVPGPGETAATGSLSGVVESAASIAGGLATEADLLSRDYEVDIGGGLTRAWEVFKANAGGLIGVSVVVYLIIFGVAMVAYLLMAAAHVPFLNFITVLIDAPLVGGLWLFYIRQVRNQEAGLGDAFSTFGPGYWQLVLTQLIPLLISMGVLALLGFMGALAFPALGGRHHGGSTSSMAPALLIPLVVLAVIGVLVMIYLTTCWLFALPLVADKRLKFWPALELSRRVVNKHWWMTFWLVVVSGVLTMVGLCVCCLGVLVTGPVAFGMLAVHYNKVFGDLLTSTG